MTNEEFYTRCSEILGVEHNYNKPVFKRTRWNNRILGNGRFPGFGLIRCFGVKVMITSKSGTELKDSKDEAILYLQSMVLKKNR